MSFTTKSVLVVCCFISTLLKASLVTSTSTTTGKGKLSMAWLSADTDWCRMTQENVLTFAIQHCFYLYYSLLPLPSAISHTYLFILKKKKEKKRAFPKRTTWANAPGKKKEAKRLYCGSSVPYFSFKDRSHECHLFNDKDFSLPKRADVLPLLTAVSSHPWRRTNRYTKPRLWAKSLNIKRKESQKFLSLFLW